MLYQNYLIWGMIKLVAENPKQVYENLMKKIGGLLEEAEKEMAQLKKPSQ